jgi:hypothetical protein
MLADASTTLLEILIPAAMCRVIEDALRTPQASLAGELHRHSARALGQGLLAYGLGGHNEAVGKLETS